MPRTAQGSIFVADGAVYARVVVGPKKYVARSLHGIVDVHDDLAARAWASTLQQLVTTLRELGRSADIEAAVDTALGVGRDDRTNGLDRVRKSLGKLRGEADDRKLATVPTAIAKPGTLTFKKFGERWTSGALHREYPDHIPLKKSALEDARRLAKYVYGVMGHLPLGEVTLKHAQEVLRRVPPGRSTALRRHVAQVMVRLLGLAVYPCELLKVSPLPKGFLPRVKVRAGAYLYPAEDRALLACVGTDDEPGVPLVNRLLYGFLAREGMRKEEALGLARSDLDLEHGAVRLDSNKTDDPRAWALDPGTADALHWWRKTHHPNAPASAAVFPDVDDHGDHLAEALREHMKRAGLTRPELFEHGEKRRQMNVHGLRATFVTISLANGRSETWVMDRTGHRSSVMVNRYRRVARTVAELGLGPLVPLHKALPEARSVRLVGAGKVQGRGARRGERVEPKTMKTLAEREGFEPSGRLHAHMISSHAPSATRSPLQRQLET